MPACYTKTVIDLHCHLLPGIDDGAPTLEIALAMARAAVADGITVTACTPHIYPGLYENHADGIERAIAAMQFTLDRHGIALRLVAGADVHVVPDLLEGLKQGRIPTLAGSRYFLFEPPHHVALPRLEELAFSTLAAGYVPVVTHPERLTWIDGHYEVFQRMAQGGAWMQITAGALCGHFGKRPRYWAERMLDEGLVHIVATDAHHIDKRPPLLAEARAAAAKRVGDSEATHLVQTRPRGILENAAPAQLLPVPQAADAASTQPSGLWHRLFGRA
jgi:protein-tyrosine phosphatase